MIVAALPPRYKVPYRTLPGLPGGRDDPLPAPRRQRNETYSLRRLFRLRLVGPVPQPRLKQADVHLLGEFSL